MSTPTAWPRCGSPAPSPDAAHDPAVACAAMSTLVCFHAHPDDECITTGGVMAQAQELGHRVVLVTRDAGRARRDRRRGSSPRASSSGRDGWSSSPPPRVLGVDRLEFLGLRGLGHGGGARSTTMPDAFWSADVDEAAQRLASILAEEQPEVFAIYDDHG